MKSSVPCLDLPRKIGYSAYRLFLSLWQDGMETTAQKLFYRVRSGKFIVREKYFQGKSRQPDRIYRLWREARRMSDSDLDEMREKSRKLSYQPLISIVIPVYRPGLPFLRRAIRSVREQCYPKWQLCVCDDGSNDPASRELLEEEAAGDARIICAFEEKNGGISSASQKAAALAQGDFIAFMDQDDLLSPDALYRAAERLNDDPSWDILYSDNDKVDLNETHCEVYFKPEYSPDEILCHNYIGHLTVMRKKLFDDIGGFLPGFDGAQDFEILLRAEERTDRIAHLPYVLYSWRKTPGSTASSPGAKRYAYESGLKSLESAFRRRGMEGTVEVTDEQGLYRCRFAVRDPSDVSLLLSLDGSSGTGSLRKTIAHAAAADREVLVHFRGPPDERALRAAESAGARIVADDGPAGSPAVLNRLARESRGRTLVFVTRDFEPPPNGWIEALLEPAQRKGVGAVGPKILGPDGTILHGGYVLGLGGFLGSAFAGVPDDAVIYNQPHRLIRNAIAVSSWCMAVDRRSFELAGGFDERLLSPHKDLDLGLALRKAGRYVVWTPFCVLRVASNGAGNMARPEGLDESERRLREKWPEALSRPDFYYNPNLTREYFDFSPDAG